MLPPLTALAAVRERLATDSARARSARRTRTGPATGRTPARCRWGWWPTPAPSLVEIGHSDRRARRARATTTWPARCGPPSTSACGRCSASASRATSATRRRPEAARRFVLDQVQAALVLARTGELDAGAGRLRAGVGDRRAAAASPRPHEVRPVLDRLPRAHLSDAGGSQALAAVRRQRHHRRGRRRCCARPPSTGCSSDGPRGTSTGLLALVEIGAAHASRHRRLVSCSRTW